MKDYIAGKIVQTIALKFVDPISGQGLSLSQDSRYAFLAREVFMGSIVIHWAPFIFSSCSCRF